MGNRRVFLPRPPDSRPETRQRPRVSQRNNHLRFRRGIQVLLLVGSRVRFPFLLQQVVHRATRLINPRGCLHWNQLLHRLLVHLELLLVLQQVCRHLTRALNRRGFLLGNRVMSHRASQQVLLVHHRHQFRQYNQLENRRRNQVYPLLSCRRVNPLNSRHRCPLVSPVILLLVNLVLNQQDTQLVSRVECHLAYLLLSQVHTRLDSQLFSQL